MKQPVESQSPWVRPIHQMIGQADRRGAFFVAMPEYRPDLVGIMAEELGLTLIDFRAERMRPLGWEAGRLHVDELTREIELRSNSQGIVLHNAEALLATKPEAERRRWLASVIGSDWPTPVVIPIAIFQADLPLTGARFHRADPDTLPTDTLLTRLAIQ